MGEQTEWEQAQLKPSDFLPLGLTLFKAFFAAGIVVPLFLAVYGIFSYVLGH